MRARESATRVIYVRHGLTDFPNNRIYCDDSEDPALNAEGAQHAKDAADLLAQQTIDAIYASPSLRTRSTAEAIAKATGVEIQFAPALRERRFGIWDGLYFEEIEQRYPDEYLAWKRDIAGYTPEGGETMEGLQRRTATEVDRIVARHNRQTAVVVTHVGPIRVCVADALKIPLKGYRQLRIDYGSLTCIDYGRSQNNLIYANLAKPLFNFTKSKT